MILPKVLTPIALLTLLGGCSGAADIPSTPDLTALQRNYDQPTAELDMDGANDAIAQNPTLAELAAAFRAAGYATDGVKPAGDSAKQGDDAAIQLQGGVHVTLRCPGDLDAPSFGTNGDILLTIAIAESRIRRGIGARATNCVLRGDLAGLPVRVAIDGSFAFDLGGDLGIGSPFSGRLLMEMKGTIHIAGLVFEDLSARWTSERFEYLFRRSDDSTVVVVLEGGGLRLRGRDQGLGLPRG